MKTIFINVGALDPRAVCPVVKRDELVKDVRKGFRLFGDSNRPLLGILIKCLMELVKIFSTPSQIGKSSLKVADPLLHFPFPMDGMEDMPFSINLVAMLEILGVICVMFSQQERLLWQNFIKEKLSPTVTWTIDLGSGEFAIQGQLGGTFGFASSRSKR